MTKHPHQIEFLDYNNDYVPIDGFRVNDISLDCVGNLVYVNSAETTREFKTMWEAFQAIADLLKERT